MQGFERRHPGASTGYTPMPTKTAQANDARGRESQFGADFSGIPASSRLDQERADFHAKYRSLVRDDKKMRIDAVADIVSAAFPAQPMKIGVHVEDSQVKTIRWELVAPDDTEVSSMVTKQGDPDATTKPYVLEKADLVDFGKFHLRCTGYDANGSPRVYGVRDFNVVDAPMSTDVWRHGRQGRMIFRKYEKFDPPGVRPWVNVELAFMPAESVACDDVMFIQATQVLSAEGVPLHDTVSKELDARKSESGWAVDQLETASPYYVVLNDAVTGKPEPKKEMGSVGHGGKVPGEASVIDRPNVSTDMVAHFESCAICRGGTNRGQVYGCATWGFVLDGGKVTLMPRDYTEAASAEFRSATAQWNLWIADQQGGGERAP